MPRLLDRLFGALVYLTSNDPAPGYHLEIWDETLHARVPLEGVGASVVTGECLVWPLGGKVCNHSTDHMTIETPGGTFAFDTTGLTLPGGHRLEVV